MEDPPITASLGPMGRLLRRLHSFEASEHPLPEGLSANGIRLLREGLEGLYEHLKDVPEPDPDPGATPKWWIKEVRELGYDAEDFFDEAMQSGAGGQTAGEGAIVRRSSRLGAIFRAAGSRRKQRRRQIAEDFSQLMARVDDASERWQSFQLAPAETGDRGQAGISRHGPDLSLDLPVSAASISDVRVGAADRRLVGVEVPMKKLAKLLAFGDDNQNQLKVIPIIGSAGVGKTTVARAIYRQYGGKFQCQAFVRASRNPDMRRLLTSILSQTKAPWTHAFSDAQDLIDGIIKHLQGKSYFIVVDDLWTSSEWDIISRVFPDGDCCSRILTTTQIEDVALACSGYESEYIFEMRPLNYGESRKLFFNNVFGPEGEGACPQELELVADRIIRKCGGLPLSIVNIASLLLPSKRNPAMEQWEKVESSLPSTLRTDPTSQGMKDVLILIYNKLPLHLKTCLLYLIMYPEVCTIRKVDLVKQWVAESLVGDTEYGYFDELVRRGMIQPVDTNYDGEVLSCTPTMTGRWNAKNYRSPSPTRYWLQVFVLDSNGKKTLSEQRPFSVEGKIAILHRPWLNRLIFEVEWEEAYKVLLWSNLSFTILLLLIPQILYQFLKKKSSYQRWALSVLTSPVQQRKAWFWLVWFLMEGANSKPFCFSLSLYVLWITQMPWFWGHATSENGEIAQMYVSGWSIPSFGMTNYKLSSPDVMVITLPFLYLVVVPVVVLAYGLFAERAAAYLRYHRRAEDRANTNTADTTVAAACFLPGSPGPGVLMNLSCNKTKFVLISFSGGWTRRIILLACLITAMIHLKLSSMLMSTYGSTPVALSPPLTWMPLLLLSVAAYCTVLPVG